MDLPLAESSGKPATMRPPLGGLYTSYRPASSVQSTAFSSSRQAQMEANPAR